MFSEFKFNRVFVPLCILFFFLACKEKPVEPKPNSLGSWSGRTTRTSSNNEERNLKITITKDANNNLVFFVDWAESSVPVTNWQPILMPQAGAAPVNTTYPAESALSFIIMHPDQTRYVLNLSVNQNVMTGQMLERLNTEVKTFGTATLTRS